jgi:hypothetical protein
VFGWAATVYRSNTYQMTVDFEADGQGFQLSLLDPPQPGCTITGTWNTLARHQYAGSEAFINELLSVLSYPELAVTINGVLLPSVKDREWTRQTPQAYIQVEPVGDLRVYNQGVFVTTVPHATFHIGGTVVSKLPLELPMGRNELMHFCPVWSKIRDTLGKEAAKLHSAGGTVGTDEWRSYMLRKTLLDQGDLGAETITIVPKRQISLDVFIQRLANEQRLAIATRGKLNRVEKKATELRIPILHFDTIDRARSALGLDGSDDEVVFGLLEAISQRVRNDRRYRPFQQIEVLMPEDFPEESDEDFTVLERSELSDAERWFLDVLSSAVEDYEYSSDLLDRSIHIGLAKKCEAYTDGANRIVLSRKLVNRVIKGQTSPLECALIIAHEYAHEGDSRNAGHDDVFAHRYHALTIDVAPALNKLCSDIAKGATTVAAEHGLVRSKRARCGDTRVYFYDSQRSRFAHAPQFELRKLANDYASGNIDEKDLLDAVQRTFSESDRYDEDPAFAVKEALANLRMSASCIPRIIPFLEIDAALPFDRDPSTIRLVEATPHLVRFSHMVTSARSLTADIDVPALGELTVRKGADFGGAFLRSPQHQQDQFFSWLEEIAQMVCPWKERNRPRDLIFVANLCARFLEPLISSQPGRILYLRHKDAPRPRCVEARLPQKASLRHVQDHLAATYPEWEVYPGPDLIRDLFTEFESQASTTTITRPIAFWAPWSAEQ